MSIFFLWRWELVILAYNVWNPFPRLHEASEVLTKYVKWLWSDNFIVAFLVSFIVTVFVADMEGIENKVLYLLIGTTYSVNEASTYSADLYDINSRNPPEEPPI